MRFTIVIALAATRIGSAWADCQDGADGFASLNSGTTGGNGGTVVTVSSFDDLKEYAASEGKYVIQVDGQITVTPFGYEIPVSSDKTIVGLGSTGEIYQGGFSLQSVQNVIIRNLKIGHTDDGSDEENDRDGLQADTSSNIWVDHCLFEEGGDGLLDIRKDTNYFTVSNNIFRNHDKTFGIGWTDNVTAQGTIHHNWFDGTNQRNPSADNLQYAHLYNNYLSGVTSYGHYARGTTNMRLESCYFEASKNPVQADEGATLTVTDSIFDGCTGSEGPDQGTAFDASEFYDYALDAAADVPGLVQANAGPQESVCS